MLNEDGTFNECLDEVGTWSQVPNGLSLHVLNFRNEKVTQVPMIVSRNKLQLQKFVSERFQCHAVTLVLVYKLVDKNRKGRASDPL